MYYVIYTCIVAKYGIIMLSYKTYAYYRFFQNAFPLHPIVIDTLMNFQHRGQLSFEQTNQIGDAACKNDEFGVFRNFGSRSPWNPKPWC